MDRRASIRPLGKHGYDITKGTFGHSTVKTEDTDQDFCCPHIK